MSASVASYLPEGFEVRHSVADEINGDLIITYMASMT